MPHIETAQENFRLIIDLDSPYGFNGECMDWKDGKRRFDDLCKEIKRHVDLSRREDPEFKFDNIKRCKYCKDENGDYKDGSPGCCARAQKSFLLEFGTEHALTTEAFRDDLPGIERLLADESIILEEKK